MRSILFSALVCCTSLSGAVIEGSSFEFSDDGFQLLRVTALASASVGFSPRDEQGTRYFGMIGEAEVCIAEGRISLYHPGSSEYEVVFSKRFNDAKHGVHAFVFREKSKWSAVLMIGKPDSGLNITDGLYVGVAASTDSEVRRVLAIVADHLFFYRGSPITPVKLADGLPTRTLQALMEEVGVKENEPNQALQTTSVTRSEFGKVPVSDRQRRGV